ncbi:bifunctional phosphopantothenoylcysteine decarboxylase/phosphopantothenate--cysteine ligase CoaBC [Halalkalibacillus sediminis]|uniref:Coenzyme A biosynthesis bifunctional protein CoaBC n=1 Tax=Halalkalibacillus sediminis TaxID=2018042 RepID=A0A2I0QW71_9BACI|nr:bifunctional phosphopantothenoylcysteine decarboxylase/phosphopantothenate--cysteine ligase CoaBC [Halalkalibacillus sediminis]PKR78568.1 bifunctional phosphopantothenoylcysteine decarboxylase/phosphopantothenate--cysteine ligase CoaBC [Halalkalibacillus sediminis]
MLKGKKVLLGVSGGIAAYKACSLTSKLVQQGAEVRVIMTEGATEFVQPLTFQALSRNPVFTDAFDEKNPDKIAHIDLADWADLVILAPATAHLLGRLANGLADDMLTTTLLATTAPVYIAPAMNVHMYEHPSVIENLKTLDNYGYRFIEPGDGYLACGYVGKGRLEEPENIIEVIIQNQQDENKLKGKKVLITAGPTRETVDPVRFFSNRSSGKMGFALAEVAHRWGAEVTLIAGPVVIDPPSGINYVSVTTAQEMYEAVMNHKNDQDIIIKAAAVADYRPKQTHEHKMKKHEGNLVVEMERTNDILKELGEQKQQEYLVGFAAETKDIEYYGNKKLEKKNLDAIVMNDVSSTSTGFQSDENEVIVLTKRGLKEAIPQSSKAKISERLFEIFIEEKQGEKS